MYPKGKTSRLRRFSPEKQLVQRRKPPAVSRLSGQQDQRPAGISFAVVCEGPMPPTILVDVSVGTYRRVEAAVPSDDQANTEDPAFHSESKSEWKWRRSVSKCNRRVTLDRVTLEIDLGQKKHTGEETVPGLGLFIRSLKIGDRIAVTVQAINENHQREDATRNEIEEQTFFQFKMSVAPVTPTQLVSRPVSDLAIDDDSKTSALIYRNVIEYATGHTCSADWQLGGQNAVERVMTAWVPELLVKSVDPEGDPVFYRTYAERGLGPPTAAGLAEADLPTLGKMLHSLTDAYETWLGAEATKVRDLPSIALKEQAEKHLLRCRQALDRMRFGISLVLSDDTIRRAFQTANAAMEEQASWGRRKEAGNSPNAVDAKLTWRPFQLGFALMCIKSFENPLHSDRRILDLIWFPTGGGKTEAYLLVAAFLLFLGD